MTRVSDCTLGELSAYLLSKLGSGAPSERTAPAPSLFEGQESGAPAVVPAHRGLSAAKKKTGTAVGITEIASVFGVSESTIKKWRKGFLKPALRKSGKALVMDIGIGWDLYKEYRISGMGHTR